MKSRLGWKLTAVVALLSFAPLAAIAQLPNVQNPPQTPPVQLEQNRPQVQQQLGQPGSQGSSAADAQLANCLIIDNQNEVALAQFALQKTQNDDVKKFAQQMVEQHQQAIGSLQQYASASRGAQGQQGQGNLAATPGQPGANVTITLKPELSADAGGLNPLTLKQEIAAQCLQSARRELDQKQGAEFDKTYIGMQIGAHMMMADMLQVFQNHASPEFRKTLASQQKTVQSHLDHAKQIMKSLDSKTASR
jgi:predicted outer membrane protein